MDCIICHAPDGSHYPYCPAWTYVEPYPEKRRVICHDCHLETGVRSHSVNGGPETEYYLFHFDERGQECPQSWEPVPPLSAPTDTGQ